MKFSFEAGGYRKNLAEQLKTERSVDKDGAEKLLEQERSTLQYQVSEDIKKVQRKIKEKRGESVEEENQITPEKISTEVVKMEGSDGVEHELEISTIDISDQIPDEIKLVYDIYRLAVLDTQFKHLDLGPRVISKSESDNVRWHNWEWIVIDYVRHKSGEKGDLSKELEDYVDDEIPKTHKIFLNRITNGSFLDDQVFAHVVGAEEDAQRDLKKRNRLKEMWANEQGDGTVAEKAFDVRATSSERLWVNAGGVSFTNFFKPTLLLDSRNKRLRTEVESLSFYNSLDRGNNSFYEYLRQIRLERRTDKLPTTIDEEIDAGVMKAAEKTQVGVCLNFKRDEPWLYIADWMIDAYHGRLYKITEKSPQEKID